MGKLIEHRGDSRRAEDILMDSNGESHALPSSVFDLDDGGYEKDDYDTPENRRFLLEYFASGDMWRCAKSAGLTGAYTRQLIRSEWFRKEYQSLRQAHGSKYDKSLEIVQAKVIESLLDRVRYGDEVVMVVEGEVVKVKKEVNAQQLMTILDKVTKHRVMMNSPMNVLSRNNPDSDALPIEHAAHPANPAHMADPQKQIEMAKKLQAERLRKMEEILGGGHVTVDAQFTEVDDNPPYVEMPTVDADAKPESEDKPC